MDASASAAIAQRKQGVEEFLDAHRQDSICLLGTGDLAAELVRQLDLSRFHIKAFLDTSPLIGDSDKTGQALGPFDIRPFSDLHVLEPDIVILVLRHPDFAFRKLLQLKHAHSWTFRIVQDLFKPRRDAVSQDILAMMPNDIEEQDFHDIYAKSRDFTMTGLVAMYALYQATRHVVRNDIPGHFVECGVFKGGSCLVVAHTLLTLGVTDRKIYLYDTFGGMSTPTDKDTDYTDISAAERMHVKGHRTFEEYPDGVDNDLYSLRIVRQTMFRSGYPQENFVFVPGKVEDTIPLSVPDRISILRLDTDWYQSTHHELIHLYPRLSDHGILVLDDYGHWRGSRLAADEYFAQHDEKVFLNRITDEVRLVVKPPRAQARRFPGPQR